MINPATDFLTGELILIDKFKEWTSFDVVNKIRSQIKYRRNIPKIKVGHAGTLDPLATGLLIICTGKKTKELHKYQAAKKEYIAKIKLGETTPSLDLETEVDKQFPIDNITEKQVISVIDGFIGEQEQMPPVYSAKRVNGKRAYKSARKGESIDLKPVTINIFDIKIINLDLPIIELKIICSKGTYIRAIAGDIGTTLKNGAHLIDLRRTKIGDFCVEDAISVEQFEKML
ncbi:MAG: tRNA pseudouridine(55) synthase TruB [Bacteroidales bacterium]|nr:tRNA pseudouridine(55) synthase TruB [Bacteroidales bacterium]